MFSSTPAKHGATMSLSILVVIEMFNACNSLSENESLLSLPLWGNPYLIVAIVVSMVLHFAILYVPFLASLFGVTPLNWVEWKAVLAISAPVVLIDEVLKFVTRTCIGESLEESWADRQSHQRRLRRRWWRNGLMGTGLLRLRAPRRYRLHGMH